MKTQIKITALLTLLVLLGFTSCRTEEFESIQIAEENALQPNSVLANQLQRVAMNDGSKDNIIYNANCFNIQFPVTVTVNGIEITVNSDDDYDDIEDLFDEFDDDDDTLEINFPITIVLANHTQININSLNELEDFANTCNGENEIDDDIECLDFVYPINISIFNKTTEVITAVTINNDSELYFYIDDLDDDDDDNLITFNFPLTLVLFDGSELSINSFNELDEALNLYGDDCDEDDDFDFNDDDCDNCSTDQLSNILTGCSDWIIDDLERNDNDLDDLYEGYVFNFLANGILTVTNSGTTENGTWSASGEGNNIVVTLNVPNLNDINATWNLHEIELDDETSIDLEIDDDNELKFKSNCI